MMDLRLAALRRFAIAISILNIAGHAFLGFEQSLGQLFASLATAYSLEIFLEVLDAKVNGRALAFAGGLRKFVDFLLPSHITGLAVGMLLYANDQIFPIVFAATVAIGSKAIFRAPVRNGVRHFFNPSNFGIAVTLFLFPWVGIAPPYQFSESLGGIADWILPCIFILTGTLLNSRLTGRMPLIFAWLGAFALQAVIRNVLIGTSWVSGLGPMTGVAFLLFTFYMITDPGTTPSQPSKQIVFGASVASVYSVLMVFHVAYGLFFALVIVCVARGLLLHTVALRRVQQAVELSAPEPARGILRQG
jgi:hypothetical protein